MAERDEGGQLGIEPAVPSPVDVNSVDFAFAGAGVVRAVNPSPPDVATLSRQLGSKSTPVNAEVEPLLVVEFVDDPLPTRHALIGLHEAAYDDDGGFYATKPSLAGQWVRIPFGDIRPGCRLVASTGTHHIFHLIAVLNLIVLQRGVVPLHAAALRFRDAGVLIVGWSKGGKSELLLGAMSRGATYVADEWAYLHAETGTVTGLPEPIRLWDRFYDVLPEARQDLDVRRRARFGLLSLGQSAVEALDQRINSRALKKTSALLGRQRYVTVSPHELFGSGRCAPETTIDHLILVESHSDDTSLLEPLDPTVALKRLDASLWAERQPLRDHYTMFRYAFPDRRDDAVEQAAEREQDLIDRGLGGVDTMRLLHPFPAPIATMTDLLEDMVR